MGNKKELATVNNVHKTVGFKITDYHGDNEFNCIRDFLRPTTLHTCEKVEHVGPIEETVRTAKQRTRHTINVLPSKADDSKTSSKND